MSAIEHDRISSAVPREEDEKFDRGDTAKDPG